MIDADLFKSSYNICPMRYIPVFYSTKGKLTCRSMQFGVSANQGFGPNLVINSRFEEAGDKPMFRQPLKTQRCVVMLDGYYEWKTNGTKKVPHYIYLEKSKVMAVAALYFEQKDGSTRVVIMTQSSESN